jgi:hypothetical protein
MLWIVGPSPIEGKMRLALITQVGVLAKTLTR